MFFGGKDTAMARCSWVLRTRRRGISEVQKPIPHNLGSKVETNTEGLAPHPSGYCFDLFGDLLSAQIQLLAFVTSRLQKTVLSEGSLILVSTATRRCFETTHSISPSPACSYALGFPMLTFKKKCVSHRNFFHHSEVRHIRSESTTDPSSPLGPSWSGRWKTK